MARQRFVSSIRDAVLDSPVVFNLQQRLFDSNSKSLGRVFGQHLHPSHSILDIGCGTGSCAHNLLPADATNYLGIDVSPAYIRYAQKRYPERNFTCGDVVTFEWGTNRYDRVLVMSILHHLSDSEAAAIINAIRSLLNPGGLILAAEPIFSSRDGSCKGSEKIRRFASNILLRCDRGRFIRTQNEYLKLWNGVSIRHGSELRIGLHEFCGFILTA